MFPFCDKTQQVTYYSNVTQIPEKIWTDLAHGNNPYFSTEYLSALADNNTDIDFYYMVLFNNHNKAIAFCTLQIVHFKQQDLEENQNKLLEFTRNILFKKAAPIKILICGNTFVSGEHGILIAQNQNKKAVLKAIIKAIKNKTNSIKHVFDDISIFMLKDFEKASLHITNELKEFNYYAFTVAPNMQLSIADHWKNFDDYLSNLKTKFRVKAKKAMTQSNDLEMVAITSKNCEAMLPQMKTLYKKVTQNAAFNLSDFDINTYKDLKENLGENYILVAYFLNNKMVGFLSGMVNHTILDAHFVGIDYELNKPYAIYQRMLYDYIKIGIAKQLKVINFGRTASEIKSSIGAVPQELTIYIRHKKTLKNKILKVFLQQIAPTTFHQKYPFKQLTS